MMRCCSQMQCLFFYSVSAEAVIANIKRTTGFVINCVVMHDVGPFGHPNIIEILLDDCGSKMARPSWSEGLLSSSYLTMGQNTSEKLVEPEEEPEYYLQL